MLSIMLKVKHLTIASSNLNDFHSILLAVCIQIIPECAYIYFESFFFSHESRQKKNVTNGKGNFLKIFFFKMVGG